MAGLFDFFAPDAQSQGGGLLGGFNDYVQNNQGSLLGLGLGLLSGQGVSDAYSQAMQGYMAGQRQDFTRRQLKQKEDEELQKKTAAQGLAQKYNLPVELAADPDTAIGMAKAIELQKRTPKELSFEERQFNMLSPEQQAQYRQKNFLGGDGKSAAEQYQQRQLMAQQQGLQPGDPAYQFFVLTGKMPREDAQPLTATDKKAILEADDQVLMAQNAIESLDRAKTLSGKAYDGFGAGARGMVTGAFGSDAGQATIELDNEVKNNALQSMKSIFGANPTEGERAILLEIQGASSMPAPVRERIYERGKVLVQRRLELNRQRAEGIRGGSYYKQTPQGGQGQNQPSAQQAIQIDGYTIRQR